MLKGDLATSSLEAVLTGLADDQATGCLSVSDPDGEEALVYFKNGLVYAVSVPGRRPQIGARLISSGALAPEGLAEALEAQRDELQGWRLGELLVHLGYVDREVVEAFVAEALRDAMTDLMRWHVGRWKFRKNVRSREDVAPPALVSELLDEVRARTEQWHEISETLHGPNAVPHLSTRTDSASEMTLDPDAWSLLCKVDGERSVAELARDCGFTLLEAGRVVLTLVQAGLVDVEEDVATAGAPAVPLVPEQATAPDDVDPAAIARSLAAAFAMDDEPGEQAGEVDEAPAAEADTETSTSSSTSGDMIRHPHTGADFADSIARVSQALSELLGPSAASAASAEALFEVPEHLRVGRGLKSAPQEAIRTEEDERRERVRAAAAEELVRAHASAEEEHRHLDASPSIGWGDATVEPAVEPVVDPEPQPESAPEQAVTEIEIGTEAQTAAETDAQAEADSAPKRGRSAAKSDATAEEVASVVSLSKRRRSRKKQADDDARRAEEARLAAEAEQARFAEEAAHARMAEEARLAAEAEQARLAEEAAHARMAEEARLAAEAEQARLAEEAEQARLAEEAEQARLAEEAEQARLAEEAEQARLAEEARIAAAEAERAFAAEAEAARLAEEARLAATEADEARLTEEARIAALEADEAAEREMELTAPVRREATDTAALLRELSSLGLDDDGPSSSPTPPRAPAAPRPTTSGAPKTGSKTASKKRKGLFGRN